MPTKLSFGCALINSLPMLGVAGSAGLKMLSSAMQNTSPELTPKRRLTPRDWATIKNLYERGEAHGNQLAARYGVHRNTISSGMKARGAMKACRVHEVVAELKPLLDAQAKARWLAKVEADEANMVIANRRTAMIGELMDALVSADREGRLAEFGQALKRTMRQ